jgi:hypothetical protein
MAQMCGDNLPATVSLDPHELLFDLAILPGSDRLFCRLLVFGLVQHTRCDHNGQYGHHVVGFLRRPHVQSATN